MRGVARDPLLAELEACCCAGARTRRLEAQGDEYLRCLEGWNAFDEKGVQKWHGHEFSDRRATGTRRPEAMQPPPHAVLP